MKAVVMAGGRGTRLRPLTSGCPKPLVPIANRPIVEHIVCLLKENGFDKILLTTHYLPDQLEDWLSNGEDLGVEITHVREEEPLGTAGGVKQLERFLDDTFLVISGDCLTDFSLRGAYESHKRTGADATIVVTNVENPLPFGIVETKEEGRVARFLEKPTPDEVFSKTVNTGIYVLEPDVLGLCPHDSFFDFSRDLFPAMLAEDAPLFAYEGEGYWSDIGDCVQYIRSQIDALYGRVRLPSLAATDRSGVWIDEGAVVEEGARVISPIMIGRNAYVASGARVGPGVVLGHGSRVETGAVIERSVIWEGAVARMGSTVLGAAIGRCAEVGRGACVLEGAVLGDGTRLKSDQFVSAGTRIAPEIAKGRNHVTG